METRGKRPSIRRKALLVLRATAVLVVVGSLGTAVVAALPSVSKFCTVAGSIDEVGAATPGAARTRWAASVNLEIDIEAPDSTTVSGDRLTATYLLERPRTKWANPDHTYLQEIVTERSDDDVWRVTGANKCERWATA